MLVNNAGLCTNSIPFSTFKFIYGNDTGDHRSSVNLSDSVTVAASSAVNHFALQPLLFIISQEKKYLSIAHALAKFMF